MRARIALRLAGKIPPKGVHDEDLDHDIVRDEIKAIQRGNGRSVREDEIIAAFSRGDEVSPDSSQCIDILRSISPFRALISFDWSVSSMTTCLQIT